MRRFPATMDSLAKILSFVVILVTLIPILTIVTMYTRNHDPLLLLAPVVVVVALFITSIYRVKEYVLDSEGLHIIRPVGEARYPLHQFRSIATVTTKELGLGIRTFGSGGFLGYFGKFYYRKHGHVTLYVTNRDNMILITLADERKFIISPDDPAAFMAAFQELMKR